MKTILLVCTGNTCRSPMGQALLEALLVRHGVAGYRVESAGLAVVEGEEAAQEAVDEIASRGMSLASHRARQLTGNMLADADWVIFMNEEALRYTAQTYPQYASRMMTMARWAQSDGAVADPYGQGAQAYREAADQMERWLEAGVRARLLGEP